MRYVIIPGIGGSDGAHWQSRWQADLGHDAVRIAPPSWDEPELSDWLTAISRCEPFSDTVLVAHSLGCIAATSWLALDSSPRIGGAFLVAPPDCDAPGYPREAASFVPDRRRLAVPALTVLSSNDAYITLPVARRLAQDWGARTIVAGALGHINTASNVGPWKQGRDLLEAFTAGLRIV